MQYVGVGRVMFCQCMVACLHCELREHVGCGMQRVGAKLNKVLLARDAVFGPEDLQRTCRTCARDMTATYYTYLPPWYGDVPVP